MKRIIIGNQELKIKDYYCAYDGEYLPREDGKLWLYVNITDSCNGSCPFCINPNVKSGKATIDPATYRKTLSQIKDYIYGVSLTGGEPLLFPGLVNEILSITQEVCGSHVEKDTVTNGTEFEKIPEELDLKLLDSIHLSRHRIEDTANDEVFGFSTVSAKMIAKVISRLEDPAQIVLNCVLMKDGIDTNRRVSEYLEFASGLGVRNVSFIGLSKHNEYCKTHYIDPNELNITGEPGFHIWNEYRDHDYCNCCSGSYDARSNSIRFYYRRMGEGKAPYARQLVYNADNCLLAGFSGKEIRFDQDK